MKVFLLAAGYGTRLRPLTDTVPKCLIPLCGQPVLGWWLDLLRAHGVTEALVNTHYLRDAVRAYISEYNARGTGLRVQEFYEPELLGSAGTVWTNRDFVAGDASFFICYADNLTNINLTAMRKFHEGHSGVLTMALFRSDTPQACGIARLGERGEIIHFVEKPQNPKSNLANAGIYIANASLLDNIPAKKFTDFGTDVLPLLAGQMYGWEVKEYIIDIGTHENYQRAQKEWKYV